MFISTFNLIICCLNCNAFLSWRQSIWAIKTWRIKIILITVLAQNIRGISIQMLFLRKGAFPYFQLHKNKKIWIWALISNFTETYKLPRIVFEMLYFKFIMSEPCRFYLYLATTVRIKLHSIFIKIGFKIFSFE